jgi:RNA-binding protein
MNEPIESAVELTSGQKKVLRGMGHHLEPVVYVGKEGLSPALLKSVEAALDAHELIKLKLGQNCPIARDAAGQELTTHTGAATVQIIGRMILLYRPNPDLPEDKRVTLSSQAHIRSKKSNAK